MDHKQSNLTEDYPVFPRPPMLRRYKMIFSQACQRGNFNFPGPALIVLLLVPSPIFCHHFSFRFRLPIWPAFPMLGRLPKKLPAKRERESRPVNVVNSEVMIRKPIKRRMLNGAGVKHLRRRKRITLNGCARTRSEYPRSVILELHQLR